MSWFMVLAVYSTGFWLFWIVAGKGFWESVFWLPVGVWRLLFQATPRRRGWVMSVWCHFGLHNWIRAPRHLGHYRVCGGCGRRQDGEYRLINFGMEKIELWNDVAREPTHD